MSGKSTYMCQVALIILLAQVGSFVPAWSARVGLVDGVANLVDKSDYADIAIRRHSHLREHMSETDDICPLVGAFGHGPLND